MKRPATEGGQRSARRATIRDVAEAAGVSVATVSRALNGHENVAAAVRGRVQETAARLRYIPHAAARSLSSRRTHTIGMVLPALHCEFFSQLVRFADRAARERGQHLLVSSYHDDPDAQIEALRTMRGRVDGMLVMSPYGAAPNPLGEELATLPAVLINPQGRADGMASLGIDNHGGAVAMVEHLIGRGHRRIAFLAGSDACFDAFERRRGYREALARLLPGEPEWILAGEGDEASGHRAGRELLRSGTLPDALFASNDVAALGCLCALAEAGVRVPERLAVVGFDDVPLACYVKPALTTMRVDLAELSTRAVQMLLEQVEAGEERPAPGAPGLLTPQLVVRASCVRDALPQPPRGTGN
jgi:LacI family transcriptional regulator